MFKSIYTIIIKNIQKSLGKGLSWIIDSVIDHIISISKHNPLARSSCIKLPKELDHPRKSLINIQNTDDYVYLKWCLARFLNPTDHHPARVKKADKTFAKRLDLIKFPVETRDIHKIEKRNSIGISVFGYENKVKHPIYISKKCCQDKHVDLLLVGEGEKKHYHFLSKISIHSCMIIHYIMEENIFGVIVCKLLEQQKN